MADGGGAAAISRCRVVSEPDLLQVRQLLREHARSFSPAAQTKLITAGSELARNILKYGGPEGGQMEAQSLSSEGRVGVRAVFSDAGPGIADIDLAMQDGFSSSGSLGLGLPGARRLVDEFDLQSAVGRGTTVTIVKWAR